MVNLRKLMNRMTQKDLAQEYALARLQGRLSGNEVSFSENKVFTEEDIKAAFNAGRESVMENMPDLKWYKSSEDMTLALCSGCIALANLTHYGYTLIEVFICFLIRIKRLRMLKRLRIVITRNGLNTHWGYESSFSTKYGKLLSQYGDYGIF